MEFKIILNIKTYNKNQNLFWYFNSINYISQGFILDSFILKKMWPILNKMWPFLNKMLPILKKNWAFQMATFWYVVKKNISSIQD